MHLDRSCLARVVLLGVLVLGGCARPLGAGKRGAGAWRELTTAHFVLRTDLGPREARRTVAMLERYHDVLTRFAFVSRNPLPGRIAVVWFGQRGDYARFAPGLWRVHAASGGPDPAAGATLLASGDLEEDPGVTQQLLHELGHHVLRYQLGRGPRWLSEGLALYYSTMTEDYSELVVGTPPWPPQLCESLAARAPSVRELLTDDTGLIDPARAERFVFGAWDLVHLLIHSRVERAAFARFANDVSLGHDPGAAWLRAFGELRPEDLEPRYRAHSLVAGQPRIVEFRGKRPPRPERERVLSAAEVALLRAQLRPWDRFGLEAVERDLREAAGHPDGAERSYLLGRLRQAQGRLDEAETELRAALAARPGEERYWQGLATLLLERRRAAGAGAAAPAALDEALTRLAETARGAPALAFLAERHAERRDTARALETIDRAIAADAACWRCFETRASVLLAAGDADAALTSALRAVSLLPHHESGAALLALVERCRKARTGPPAVTAPPAPPTRALP